MQGRYDGFDAVNVIWVTLNFIGIALYWPREQTVRTEALPLCGLQPERPETIPRQGAESHGICAASGAGRRRTVSCKGTERIWRPYRPGIDRRFRRRHLPDRLH